MKQIHKLSLWTALLQLIFNWNYNKHICVAFTIDSKSWNYEGYHIGYEESKNVASSLSDTVSDNIEGTSTQPILPQQHSTANDPNNNTNANPVAILLLNGFGVGSFHQHRLMPKITSPTPGKTTLVYGVDYLGQGRSWPVNCDDGNAPSEQGLIYSIDTWADQVIRFVEEVIMGKQDGVEKVHLVGNSVGGLLAVVLASRRPDLFDSVCLLNATPVWGLNFPGWSGHLPAPAIPKAIGRFLFDRIRDLNTIESYLENAYANRGAFGEKLMKQIRNCTEGNGGHAAFASILWSPPATFPSSNKKDNFYSNLSKLECDVLLIFGRDDPWCKPSFGRRMFTALCSRDGNGDKDNSAAQRYIELENVGHCPNHEAPSVVGQVVSRWVHTTRRRKDELRLIDEEVQLIPEPWGDISAREIQENDAQLSRLDMILTNFVG